MSTIQRAESLPLIHRQDIVALYSGIYKEKERVVEGLKTRLYKDCFKIKGGFVGAPLMCKVMAENGMEQEALYFLTQEGYPG